MGAQASSLHEAVRGGDLRRVRYLVGKKGAAVNEKNNNGWTLLHEAAYQGHLEVAKYLIDKGATMNEKGKAGDTPLHEAVRNNHLDLVKYLVDKGATMNEKGKAGDTPLHEAVRNNHLDLVKYLVDKGATMNEKRTDGDTPLHLAVRNNHLDLVKYLVDKGAAVNEKRNDGRTPLHRAAYEGRLNVVKYLINKGAAVNEKGEDGWTPLHLAVEENHFEVVKYLINKGATVNEKGEDGDTPLHVAARCGHLDMVAHLINKGATVNEKSENDDTPLHLAVREGNFYVVKYLINNGAPVNEKGEDGDTPLHEAAREGHFYVAMYLINNGAPVNEKGDSGDTPLHEAARNNRLNVIKYLINKGALVNEKNNDGWTPLHLATYQGHLNVIKYLINKGAPVNEKKNDGWTPLHLATYQGHLNVIEYLFKKGAAVNEKKNDGWTLLHEAARCGHVHMIEYLINKGALVNEKNNDDWTPLHLAAYQGHFDVVKYLIDKGATVNEKGKNGDTPLHLALGEGHFDMVKYLIAKEAEAIMKTDYDKPSLHETASEGHLDVVTRFSVHDSTSDTVEYKTVLGAATEIKDVEEVATNSLVLQDPINGKNERALMEVTKVQLPDQQSSTISSEDSKNATNAFEITSHDGLETIVHHNAVRFFEGNVNDFRNIAEVSEQDVDAKARVQLVDGTEELWMVPEYAASMVESLLDASALGEEARPIIEYLQQRYSHIKRFVDRYCKDSHRENSDEIFSADREAVKDQFEKIGERIAGLNKYAFDDVVPRHMLQLRFICSKKLRKSVQEYHEELGKLVSQTGLSDFDDLYEWESHTRNLQMNHEVAWSEKKWDEIDLPLRHQIRILELGIRIENDLDQELKLHWFPTLRSLPEYYHRSAELDFSQMPRRGEGGYGIVYIGQWADATAAFKVSKIFHKTDELRKEANTSFPLRHDNVIEFRNLSHHSMKGWVLIFEYAAHGDIKTFLKKHNNHDRLKYLELALKLLLDAAKGLVWVHKRKIIHNDLHIKNILICGTEDEPVAKISDFGLALKEQGSAPTVSNRGGFRYWHAPEYNNVCAFITNATDVFAFGTCFYQALHPNQAPPWNDRIGVLSVVESGIYPKIDDNEEATQLFKDMCHSTASRRPTSEQVVERLTALLEQVRKRV